MDRYTRYMYACVCIYMLSLCYTFIHLLHRYRVLLSLLKSSVRESTFFKCGSNSLL